VKDRDELLRELHLKVSDGTEPDWDALSEDLHGRVDRKMLGDLRSLSQMARYYRDLRQESEGLGASAEPSGERQWGHLEIIEEAGRGSYGCVYRARDTTLGRPVAIKLISAHAIHTASGRQRALREAELLARLSNPSICTIHAAGSWRDQPYLVMECIAVPLQRVQSIQ